jgi:hypothetical protein
VKLKPFSKQYLAVAMEHDQRMKHSKSPVSSRVNNNNSTLQKNSISNENSISKILNSNRNNQVSVNRKSVTNSRDLKKEIQQIRAENEIMSEYVQKVERRSRNIEANQAAEVERPQHE